MLATILSTGGPRYQSHRASVRTAGAFFIFRPFCQTVRMPEEIELNLQVRTPAV
jgi:hypothetical protein